VQREAAAKRYAVTLRTTSQTAALKCMKRLKVEGVWMKGVGLKPEQVADRARLSQRTLEGIEAGTANPSWDTADRIARALDWSIGELAQRATELETKDRQPTNRPLARGKDQS